LYSYLRFDYNKISMKKGWIITLILLGVFFAFQQSVVMSKATTKSRLLAVYNDVTKSCKDSERTQGWDRLTDTTWLYLNQMTRKQYYINKCIDDSNNSENYCCVCFENPSYTPEICTQLIAKLSETPVPTTETTITPIPDTPTPEPIKCTWSWGSCVAPSCGWGNRYPTITPAMYGGTCTTPTPNPCYLIEHCPQNCIETYTECSGKCGESGTQTQRIIATPAWGGNKCGAVTITCTSGACGDKGQGGSQNNNLNNNTTTIIGTLYDAAAPTPTRGPTPTPVKAQFVDYYLQVFKQASPTPSPTKTPSSTAPNPTVTPSSQSPAIPTLPPTSEPSTTPPPSAAIPQSVATQTHDKGKTVSVFKTDTISEVTISLPTKTNTQTSVAEKPFVPQEQKLLAQNAGMGGSGIMVTLQQKTGAQLVTRQDELTIKRGNQFFSISNQNNTTTAQAGNSTSNTTQSSNPRLEINANNVVAQSTMALSVDPLSGILTVETPNGPQKVSIMPDEALGIILELKALNSGIPDPTILLVSENGKLIYRISGSKVEKFIGLLPIAIQKQILVSADTGSIIKVELPIISSILSFFTF
jgi:hypothetical protein